jgi:hypothetical protein
VSQQVSSLAEGSVLDDGSRMIVVSWMVEVAEEFGLQQETLHAAVSLLDRFLSTSNVSVVWARVAVGCALGGWVGGWVHRSSDWSRRHCRQQSPCWTVPHHKQHDSAQVV